MAHINGYQPQGSQTGLSDQGESVDSRHPDYVAEDNKRRLINTLIGGTPAMRGTGEFYLPKFPNEPDGSYTQRLNRSYLNPSFAIAVESHSSKPFSQKVVIEGAIDDPRVSGLELNADGQGNDITEYGKRKFVDADQYGMSHTIVDYSTTDAISLADELAGNNSARFVHVRCLDLFYWDAEVVNGKHEMVEIRYHQEATVSQGRFGKSQVKQIVRWLRDSWEVYQKTDNTESVAANRTYKDGEKIDKIESDWELINSGVNTLGYIPLVTTYFKRKGFMQAEPPNYELAQIVLEHYQDMSDQKNLESIARVGILSATGFQDDEIDKISIGAHNLVASQNTEAKLTIVEHTGSAVAIGRGSLKVLEDKMEELSLKPELNRTSGDVTASEVLSNAFNSMSDLMSWTNASEDGLRKCYEIAYDWIGAELPEDFKLSVYKDFTVAGNVSDAPVLLNAFTVGAIDQGTLLFELKRRSLIDISHDLPEIITKSKAEKQEAQDMLIAQTLATQPKDTGNANSSSSSSSSSK